MTRKLSAKWTHEKATEMEFVIDDEVLTEFANNIRNRLDQELLYNLCITSGWYGTTVSYQQLDEVTEWVKQNATGEYRWFDNRVAFEQSKDYEWFLLRWS
jgi:hypothetical protein